MRYPIHVLLAIGALTMCRPASAQTAYGPGGLFIHPTALTRPAGTLGLNVSWFAQEPSAGPRSEWLPVSLVWAPSERAELGTLYVGRQVSGRHHDSGGLFGRYQLLADRPDRPAVAVAGSYLGGDVQLSSLSLVASHAFARGDRTLFTLHVGAQWARRADIPITRDDAAFFAGLEIPLAQRLSLVAEAGNRFSFDPADRSAIGLVWRDRRGAQVGIGLVNVGRSAANQLFIGVGYPLGGNK